MRNFKDARQVNLTRSGVILLMLALLFIGYCATLVSGVLSS